MSREPRVPKPAGSLSRGASSLGQEFETRLLCPAMFREGRWRMLRRPSCVSPAPGCCASSRARMVGLKTATGWPQESAGIPRGTVRLHLIVLPPPLLCQYPRFPLACEDLPVEKLAPQPRGRTTDSARPRGRIRSLAFASYSGLREESNVIVCGPRARRNTSLVQLHRTHGAVIGVANRSEAPLSYGSNQPCSSLAGRRTVSPASFVVLTSRTSPPSAVKIQ